MDDKEQLELAAKAAGIAVHYIPLLNDNGEETGFAKPSWNPLTDDGDALRLARTLEMYVDFNQQIVIGFLPEGTEISWQWGEEDECKTDKAAIVRAAAEIGSRLK